MAKEIEDGAKRRVKAGRLLLQGRGCAEVALVVGVARNTVYTWKAILDEGGLDALRAVGGKGRPAQLDAMELGELRRCLLDSPTEHGFGTELWTLKRVRLLIERKFEVSFSEVHVWRILGALGFSNQKPERRAIERNEDAVQEFKKKTWPALKKKPRERID
ncbi:hypothetical protein UNDKW_4119 [Undibacterium sp. KW1]|nr:hypothetical protein UNDKW_0271 [Undibacterium sp. KW1]BBB59568.1 hypothetical protein UNDKW_1295 [Undibacterium sp. KW1]BBB61641.1 hypothetical protein UNDKW_3368 [Undibacterium sp. KW1]BBB62392.1 hypothetical protein UNDKW_4119 [Undibacterium sp. KW1]